MHRLIDAHVLETENVNTLPDATLPDATLPNATISYITHPNLSGLWQLAAIGSRIFLKFQSKNY